jgi:tryptophan synthase alpha chain
MRELCSHGAGFIYCTARRGVTGKHSQLDADFGDYLQRCRAATDLPLAVGFGIQSRTDVEALIGLADMAVIGSQTIKLVDEQGVAAVGPFIETISGISS